MVSANQPPQRSSGPGCSKAHCRSPWPVSGTYIWRGQRRPVVVLGPVGLDDVRIVDEYGDFVTVPGFRVQIADPGALFERVA